MAAKKAADGGKKNVKIHLPRLAGTTVRQQELLVGHNFKNYRIKRGEDVYVPEAVARRIEQAERAQEESDIAAVRMQSEQ